jgi:glycosyltransferase involved in cell wall biosynthesis
LAAPYPLPNVVCRQLTADGVISGYVAETAPERQDPLTAGWWVDRAASLWFLRRGSSRTILLLSVPIETTLGGRMLLEARLKGFGRILLVGPDGSIVREIDVLSALSKQLASGTKAPSYEDAFEEMYALVGDRLRLADRVFDQERVLIYVGNLEAAGTQRQVTYTACGLAKRWPGKIHVARTKAGGASDFYKPVLDTAGVATHTLCEDDEYSSSGIVQIRNELAARYSSLEFSNIFHLIFHKALLIQAIRPGLVHTFLDDNNIMAGIAADLVGVPRLVLSGRSMAPDHFEIYQPHMAPGYKALLKRRKVAFLNNSKAGAADYARWLNLPNDSFRVIHNGFEFPNEQAGVRAEQRRVLGIPENAIVVGNIAGFREEKRPLLFLEMARLLYESYPNVHFVFFGDGALLPKCREFVEARALSDVTHLPGLTSNAWAALAVMDIFVLTSRMEGLPNVLIEAQAMGLPVVSASAGGMTETFVDGQTGLIAYLDTPEGFAAAVGKLIEDRALATTMGRKAAEYARASFGLERMTDLTIEAYAGAAIKEHKFVPDWAQVEAATDIRLGGAVKDEGYGFIANIPTGKNLIGQCLWEDDERLRAPDNDPEEVRYAGRGRNAILLDKIIFSSSDGSDVRFNGRVYRLRGRPVDPHFNEIIINSQLISGKSGHCYVAHVGLAEESAGAEVWENDKRLAPGACLHDDIRVYGAGRYSLWHSDLYFSTSDNSDPRTNGRSYVFRQRKKAPASAVERITWSGAPLERAIRHMLADAAPRRDFVPGRIVHVIGSLGPGGAERQTVYTLTGLLDQGFESVQLLCRYLVPSTNERHDFYLPDCTAAGIPVRTIREGVSDDSPVNIPPSLRGIRHAVSEGLTRDIVDLFWEFMDLRPQIVHAWLDANNITAGPAAALAGVPRIVVSGRNVNPTGFGFYRPEMHPVYRALLELPQVTMVNNSYAGRDDYARWLGVEAGRISVIHNGCEFAAERFYAWRHKVRDAYAIPPDSIVVGTVARFSEEKRPDLFIEMAHRILKEQPTLLFMYFGVGPLFDRMKEFAESLGISNRVRLMGVTDDIWKSLAAMDVFVLSSRMEGLPNVLIEAQCAGIPVVATNVGGSPETFIDGKTGLGVDNATPESLGAAVLRLTLDQRLRLEMSATASRFARKEFGVQTMLARTVEVYNTGVYSDRQGLRRNFS